MDVRHGWRKNVDATPSVATPDRVPAEWALSASPLDSTLQRLETASGPAAPPECAPGEAHARVRSIAELSEVLGLKTIGEGIETSGQLAELRRLRSQFGRGYLFLPAVPASGLQALLAQSGVIHRPEPLAFGA